MSDFKNYNIQLLNVVGEIIFENTQQENKIDVRLLSSGIYFIKATNRVTGIQLINKFIKQ